MKVNKNDPIEPNIVVERYNDGTTKRVTKGCPLRLSIAADIMAGSAYLRQSMSVSEMAKEALAMADALIEEHNNSYLEK